MNVKELIKELQKLPEEAEVVSAKDIGGAWTVLSKPTMTRYRELDICVIREGAPVTPQPQQEENKPGCFGAIGLPGKRDDPECPCEWRARCKQSQEDY